MEYRLIAFDLDGTLLDDKKNIPEENLRVLAAAAERARISCRRRAAYTGACRSS